MRILPTLNISDDHVNNMNNVAIDKIDDQRHFSSESSKNNKDFFGLLTQLSNTSEQSTRLTIKDHYIDITDNFTLQIMGDIVNETNSYTQKIREEIKRNPVAEFISKINCRLTKGESVEKDLIDRMNPDMFADLSRGRYFIGDTEVSIAGNEKESFESFRKQIEKSQFKWIDENITVISKFFHQGFVQIVLSLAFKIKFKGFNHGLNNITLDRNTQNIEYHLNSDQSVELVISSRVKNAGYISAWNEAGDNKLVISDDENVSSSNSQIIPKSQLYIRIGFNFKNGELHINSDRINHYVFYLAVNKIMNI